MKRLSAQALLWLGMAWLSLVRAGEYQELTFSGVSMQVYRAAPANVRLYWRDPKTNRPYRRFSAVQDAIEEGGAVVAMMMNGGIFEPGGIPTGLHVERDLLLRPLNLADGTGNFYLKPNGVFLIDGTGKAHVLESQEYADRRISPRLALQSGPLLLRNGRIHPAFARDSRNRRDRNGVGVTADGTVLFACTAPGQKKYITLLEFAEFFQTMGCPDALFLDGDLSTMVADPPGKIQVSNEYGAILAVLAPPKEDRQPPDAEAAPP